jgi:hypothetical protein
MAGSLLSDVPIYASDIEMSHRPFYGLRAQACGSPRIF